MKNTKNSTNQTGTKVNQTEAKVNQTKAEVKETKTVESKATETKTTQSKTQSKFQTPNSKSMFDFIIEAQTKFVDSLVENTKKISDNFGTTEMIEKSRNFVNEWLEKQQDSLENTFSSVKKNVGFEKAPEALKEVLNAQETLGKEWFEALRATLKVKDSKELYNILFANVQKLQENVKEVANFWMQNIGKPVNVQEIFTTEKAKEVSKKMVELFKPAEVK